ncbi:hypothetical protein VR41_05035 [Streptomyces sp. NRRL B-1568]|nr:hypothetical protein VR41_05035 [Streptomyces sp. NRRL B-1568]
MATNSTQTAGRIVDVAITILVALVLGLVAGIGLAALGASPLDAVGGGAATFAGTFGVGMKAVSYVKQQGN